MNIHFPKIIFFWIVYIKIVLCFLSFYVFVVEMKDMQYKTRM